MDKTQLQKIISLLSLKNNDSISLLIVKLINLYENGNNELENRIMELSSYISTLELKHGIDGKTPTSEELIELIRPLIPSAKDGKDYILTDEDRKYIVSSIKKHVKNGADGADGKNYILTERDKKDIASSILFDPVVVKEKKIEEIRDGIEKLVGEEKLDVLELKNLDKIDVDYSQIKNLPQQKVIYTGGGISQETLDNALSTKADLENGKVPLEQLPDDLGGVQSVNGQTGVVELTAEDIATNNGIGGGTVDGDLQIIEGHILDIEDTLIPNLDSRVTELENNPSTPFYEADNSEITSTYAYWGFNNASPQYQINRRNVSTFEKTTAIGAWEDRLTLTYT